MDYKAMYQEKLTTAEEAVKVVKSGDWVDYGWSAIHPRVLDEALAARSEELYDVKARGGVALWRPAIADAPNAAEHFSWNSWHMTGHERKLINEGMGFYAPMRYSELPRFYRENLDPVDVAMFQVCPMDEHGWFNFGVGASHIIAMCEKARKIIVEVNENLPRCLGGHDCNIHISQVDMIVEGNAPLVELPNGSISEVDQKVAELIVEEISDGSCLQLGIGGMPNAVGALIAKSDLKDLGVHTEMYVDGFVDIALAGKITGRNKALDTGRQVYAFAAGTQKMYDYLNNNPECMGAPVDYTNDVRVVAQLDKFMSINNAVDLDLFGQINAESTGTKHISGAGGQLDFVMGAYLSKGGKSFICCSSTFKTKDGTVKSRILPTLNPGSIVTDTRANTHWLVTEYGKVNLKGLATWQKAAAIISVAHPDFRDELIAAAEQMKIWRKSNKR